MQIKDLRPNKRNPRKISEKKKRALQASVEKFGDLGCLIFNRKSNQMVGGHQRASVLPANASIKVENKYDSPTRCGTVAEGYVLVDGERFRYREVEWDEQTEAEALLAANKHQGEWDSDLLKLMFADLPELNYQVAGFELPELETMGIKLKMPTFAKPDVVKEESDEKYVRETPQTTEQIPTANPNQNVVTENPFDRVKEDTEIRNKRIVIIIDCPTQEIKEGLREKLRSQIEESGAKIF